MKELGEKKRREEETDFRVNIGIVISQFVASA